jgi:putative flippase GtrA
MSAHKLSVSERFDQFLRFSIVGGICVSLNISFLWAATSLYNVHYLVATVVAFLLINLVGYSLNRWFTFADRDLGSEGRLWRYYAVAAGSLMLNLAMMALLVDGAGLPVIAASLIVTVAFVFLNYWNHSGWTYASSYPARGKGANGK